MKTLSLAGLVIAVALLVGCGSDADQVETYPVSGTVTISGRPLPGATVMFVGEEKQPIALGRTNSQGLYKLTTYDPDDGAAEGSYAVIITKSLSTDANTGGAQKSTKAHLSGGYGSHGGAAAAAGVSGGSVVPSKYGSAETTPFHEEVKPGAENIFDFDL